MLAFVRLAFPAAQVVVEMDYLEKFVVSDATRMVCNETGRLTGKRSAIGPCD